MNQRNTQSRIPNRIHSSQSLLPPFDTSAVTTHSLDVLTNVFVSQDVPQSMPTGETLRNIGHQSIIGQIASSVYYRRSHEAKHYGFSDNPPAGIRIPQRIIQPIRIRMLRPRHSEHPRERIHLREPPAARIVPARPQVLQARRGARASTRRATESRPVNGASGSPVHRAWVRRPAIDRRALPRAAACDGQGSTLPDVASDAEIVHLFGGARRKIARGVGAPRATLSECFDQECDQHYQKNIYQSKYDYFSIPYAHPILVRWYHFFENRHLNPQRNTKYY